jgi:FkbM family methyltransferase
MARQGFRYFLKLLRRAASARLRGDREEYALQRRAMAFFLLQGDAELLTFRHGETVWTVNVGPDEIGRALFVGGAYQNPQLEALVGWLEAQGRFPAERTYALDVGANIGVPSIPLARRTQRRLVSVEPIPKNFRLLQRNVHDNGLDGQIQCVHAAVSNRPGTLTMVEHPRGGRSEVRTASGAQGFGEVGAEHHTVEVPACPLDALVKERGIAPREVALVWSDTQGYEGEVVRSGASLWQAGVPLFVEIWPRGLAAHGGAEEFLAVVRRHFRRLVTKEELLAQGAKGTPRPVDDLADVIRSLRRDHTDVLLLPE